MQIVTTATDLRKTLNQSRLEGKKIAFVPTMGFLHQGHLSLVEQAKQHGDIIVVSIFVNPLQFHNPEDFAKYPTKVEEDYSLLRKLKVDVVYAPTTDQIYPEGTSITVHPGVLAEGLEGAFRPGHFKGVTTVVSILFNQVQPDVAIFGEKDFQQLRIIQAMVKDLAFPIQIVRGALVREDTGLAMSSRNARLSTEGLAQALALISIIKECQILAKAGEKDCAKIMTKALDSSQKKFPGYASEYLFIIDEKTLLPLETLSPSVTARVVIAGYVEGVRLIDTDRLFN